MGGLSLYAPCGPVLQGTVCVCGGGGGASGEGGGGRGH